MLALGPHMSFIRPQPQLQLMGYEVATYAVQVAAYGVPHNQLRSIQFLPSLTLGIAAIQARVAAVHHDDGSGAALRAELRAFGKMRFRKSVGLLGSRLELRALFLHELALMHVELGLLEHSDRLQVPLDHIAELGDGRG